MRSWRCCSNKSCCTGLLILLSYFWLFKLYLRNLHPDYRVEQIGLIKNSAFYKSADDMLLRKIDLPFKMDNFELIEIVNQTVPQVFTSQAVLIISSSQTSVEGTYAHLLQKIQQSNIRTEPISFYVIRKLKSILFHTPKQIKISSNQITNVIEYLNKYVMVQTLTIISFEEGSLLTLRAISNIQYQTYKIISKVILINAFNPFLMIYHGNSKSFLQQVKTSILRDPIRTKHINNTRIIIIDTFGKNLGHENLNLLFKNASGYDVTFANTLTVSTRFMWNVYCHLKTEQYFQFEPFLWILTKLFNEDRETYNEPLTIKQIQNLLLYRQLPKRQEMTIQTRSKLMRSCSTFYLEQYHIFGDVFHQQCIRLIRKSDIYFNQNSTILIKSEARIQVYSDTLERLAPMDTKGPKIIYIFENVHYFRKLYIINRRQKSIKLQILGLHVPPGDMLSQFADNYSITQLRTMYRKRDDQYSGNLQSVLLCPGYTLLFPTHFFAHYKLASPAYSFNVEDLEGKCFEGDDYFYGWIRQVSKYWSLGYNLIVFTLFCSHIIKRQIFSRFYYQLIVNSLLSFLHTGDFLFTGNLLLLGIAILLEQILNLMVLMSDFINMPRKFAAKIMWPPLVFQLLRYYDSATFPSPWKVLGLQFLAATRKENVTILFLEFIYIIEYIALDLSNLFHLTLICLWLSISSFEEEELFNEKGSHQDLIIITTGKKIRSLKKMLIQLRRQLVNSIALCIMAICLSEDGMVIHYIVNFYVIAHVLFALHALFDQYIS